MKKKIFLIGGAVLLVACIVVSIVLLSVPQEPASDIGITNPNDLDAMAEGEVLSGEERDALEAVKPQRTEEDLTSLDDVTLRYLSRLDFSGLSAYLMANDELYQTDQHIQDLKVDLANIMSATDTTAPMFLISCRTSEMLAAAVAYFPMDAKLESFISADSLIFPAQRQTDIELKRADVSQEELDAKLDTVNANLTSYDRCTEVDAYDMRILGFPLRLWVTRTPDGWRPILLELRYNYSVGVLTQLEARKAQAALYRSGASLEDAVAVQPFDEAAYLADMEAHPELYNADRSRKSILE